MPRDTEGESVIPDLLLPMFSNPSALRTPPLSFALQNTGEEVNTLRCIVFFFLSYFLTEISRSAAGHGKGGGLKEAFHVLV